jgi:formate hydrogenlyase subunit 4
MEQYAHYIIPAAMLFIFPLLFPGIIMRVKARWAGRKGAPVIQPFFDVIKLLKKGEVISRQTSFVFAIAPSISLATLIAAAVIVPVGNIKPFLSFRGDFLFFAAMLSLSKFMTVLNAMDTGSSFEGMGASREMSFGVIVEPAFLITAASIAYLSGYTSLSDILILFKADAGWSAIVTVLASASLFIMLLIEGCRIPVDDPTTHLELTMIHEVMVLDNSGVDLAFIHYAAGLKMYLVAALIASLAVQPSMTYLMSTALFSGIIIAIAIAAGIIESFRPRMRMIHVPEFVLLMLSISLLTCAGVLIYISGGVK